MSQLEAFPFRGEVIWLTPDQGGRRTGLAPDPRGYRAVARVLPGVVDAGAGDFMLRGFDPKRWRSEAEGAWVSGQNQGRNQISPGDLVAIAEQGEIIAYFLVGRHGTPLPAARPADQIDHDEVEVAAEDEPTDDLVIDLLDDEPVEELDWALAPEPAVLRTIGIWNAPGRPDHPDPAELADSPWDEEDWSQVVWHLHRASLHTWSDDQVSCRLCGESLGDNLLTDGAYFWPESLAHYVADHRVGLPEEFVTHAKAHVDRIEEAELDVDWWVHQTAPPDDATAR